MRAILLLLFLILDVSCLELYGIDVSSNQKNINWKEVAKTKRFAIIRAGYGYGTLDNYWDTNYKGAKAARIKVGAYWDSYADSVEAAKKEANSMLKAVQGKQLEWPVYYHIEYQPIFDKNLQNEIATTFCRILESHRYFCGILSSAYLLTHKFSDRIDDTFTTWVSHYGVSKPSYSGAYRIWQKEYGKVDGVNGACNIDVSDTDFEPIIKRGRHNGFK